MVCHTHSYYIEYRITGSNRHTFFISGDFRYTPSMLREPCLRTNTTIDVLYLDNTNCDPNRTLPSRQRATQQIKEIIRSHPNHNVVIGDIIETSLNVHLLYPHLSRV